jgi:hypothetical protein
VVRRVRRYHYSEEGVVDAEQQIQEEPPAEARRGSHAAPDGAPVHPLIDLGRDPNPGRADHAKPDEE